MEPSHPDSELLAVLGDWKGSHVVVRVIATAPAELVAVFKGRLQGQSDEKHPAFFWPVESPQPPNDEQPGIYLHPDHYEGGRVHEGAFVVEFKQAGVTTNVRRLDSGHRPS
jgi:hypothetical protein